MFCFASKTKKDKQTHSQDEYHIVYDYVLEMSNVIYEMCNLSSDEMFCFGNSEGSIHRGSSFLHRLFAGSRSSWSLQALENIGMNN